jgi:hypothetical protein
LRTCERCGEPDAVRVAAQTILIICAACGASPEEVPRT